MHRPEDKEAGKAIRDLSAAQMVKKTEEKKKAAGDESFRAMLKDSTEAEDLQKKQQIIRTDEDRLRAIKFKVEEIKKEPTNSRLWRELGTLYQDLKKWDKAEECYRKALEVNPQDLYAQEKIGHLKEVRLDQELEEIQKQVEASGNGTDGAVLAEKLAKKKAEILLFKREEYLRRVNAHPTDYELKVKYGVILRSCKAYDDAIGQFQKSVKDPKLKIVSHTQIGHCFIDKGLYELAIGQYQLAINAVSDVDSEVGKDIRYSLANAYELKGDAGTDAEKKKADYLAAIDLFQLIMSVDITYRDISTRVDRLRQKLAQVA
jgi:tetratricopeptide (TPR) repeat protein